MRQGKRNLTELAAEVERQATAKRDFLAPTAQLAVAADDPRLLRVGEESHKLTRLAETQLAQYLDIPQEYADRTAAQHPELAARTINTWLAGKSETRLVRTLDGNARAFLSNSYRRIDNYDVMEAALPLMLRPGLEMTSLEVTETRLYIKVISADLTVTPKVGDVLRIGFVLSNSEVGLGAINLRAFTEALWCSNGMVRESVLRAAHLGRKATTDEAIELEGMTSERTNLLEDAALMSRLRDGLAYVLSEAHVTKRLTEVQRAQGATLPAALAPQVVEVVGRRLGLTGEERAGMLGKLIEGAGMRGLNGWGVANAVTALGDGAASYDRATELETAGGRVLDLGPGDWSVVLREAETLASKGATA